MPVARTNNLGGLNLYVNPLLQKDGDLIHAVNVDSYPYGAKTRRPGITTHLGTADGSAVTGLFSWTTNSGSLNLYRTSGSSLYYSIQGTGAWTLAGNGTIAPGGHVGAAVLDNTLIVGEAAGSTRHTTNGTAFTNTTLAPVGEYLAQYHNRIYVGGTSSTLFYSSAGDATNWNTSGTSDSSSLSIPGEGKLGNVFVVSDKLIATKTSGRMVRWDDFSIADMSTTKGPSSPYSIDQTEGYFFFMNREGVYGYGGAKPQLISNAVTPLIYNNIGSAVTGSNFATIPAGVHRYNYYAAIGTTTDDIMSRTINDAVLKYDFQKNEFLTYSFSVRPTAFHSYVDKDGVQQFLIGASNGQCYHLNGTANTDNGTPIESQMIYMTHLGAPEIEKKWNTYWGFFNPGCEAKVQVAVSDSIRNYNLKWESLGDTKNGVVEYGFPSGSRGRFLFINITDNSVANPFTYYGHAIDAEPVGVGR